MSFYFEKQPYEEFVIGVDFGNVLGEGETINEYEVVPDDEETVSEDAFLVDDVVIAQKILGGVNNRGYGFSFRIETSAGNKFEEDVKMIVRED